MRIRFLLPLLFIHGICSAGYSEMQRLVGLARAIPPPEEVCSWVQGADRPEVLARQAAMCSAVGYMLMDMEFELRGKDLEEVSGLRYPYFQRGQANSDEMVKTHGMYTKSKGAHKKAWDRYAVVQQGLLEDFSAIRSAILPHIRDTELHGWMEDWFARTPSYNAYATRSSSRGPQITMDAEYLMNTEYAPVDGAERQLLSTVRMAWYALLALLLLMAFWLLRGVHKEFLPVGARNGNPRQFTARGRVFTVLDDTGIVKSQQTIVTTTTQSNNQGSWTSRSETERFFILKEDGSEKSMELTNSPVRVAPGHFFSAIGLLPEKEQWSPYATFYVHNTRQRVDQRKPRRSVVKPRKRIFLWVMLMVVTIPLLVYGNIYIHHGPEAMMVRLSSWLPDVTAYSDPLSLILTGAPWLLLFSPVTWVVLFIIYMVVRGGVTRRRLNVLDRECIDPVLAELSK